MDNRAEVREFLVSRRAKITPERAGVPSYGQRRVPGLRRSEVASLAGVSVEYYAKLERGTLAGVSATVLDAISRALAGRRRRARVDRELHGRGEVGHAGVEDGIVFVNGGTAVRPRPRYAGTSIAFAGESAYAQMLHEVLADDGIYVTQLVIPGAISRDDPETSPDAIAERIWDLHQRREGFRHFLTPMDPTPAS